MATIRERRPGVWEVRAFTGNDARGRPTQVSRTVRGTKKDAQRMAAQLTLRPTRNAGGRKVGELLDEWLAFNEPTWAPLSCRDHQSRVTQLKTDPIGQVSVAALGVSDIDRWVVRLRKAGVGESAIRNRHAALRAALQQAVRWEWINHNPAVNAPIKSAERAQREVMPDEQVLAVLEAAASISEFAGLALRLAAETGARRAELAALRWDSLVDMLLVIEAQVVVLTDDAGNRTPTLQPTKTGNHRAVALVASTLATVTAMRNQWGPLTTWMFSPDAPPPNPDRIGWWWQRARKLSGIDHAWRLHDLRHWSATHAIASGADVRTVANRIGHADPSMTLRVYSHAVKSADASLAVLLGSRLDGVSPLR
jgi:integrase